MTSIDIFGAQASVRTYDVLTTGMVGATVEFRFDKSWDNLVRTAVFRQGAVTKDVVNIGTTAKIPPEVLMIPGLSVKIGVLGTNSDGTVVIPTVWAETRPVKDGTDPSGDESADPTLPVWEQILATIGDMHSLSTEAKGNLVASINELVQLCEDGTVDAEYIQQEVEKYLKENPVTETDPTVPAWAKQPEKPKYTAQEVGALPSTYTPPNQTAEQVGADPKGTAASAVSQHNTAEDSHNDIRLDLKAINERLTAFFDSDNQTLDELSEIVAYITSNKSLIDAITTSKVSVTDIVNNLTTNVTNKPLSAAQGVVLKGLIDGLSTGKLDASKLQEAVNDALAQAKASGEFDGKDGADGAPGEKGEKGDKGDTGATGATGAAGKTPVKGSDYWTEADQESIVQQVIAALGTPVFGTVDVDNNIILSGALDDGTYTIKYEDADGNLTEIGTIEVGGGYTNQIPISTDADGTIYNGIGYKANTRYSSGSGTDITHNGCYITGYIPVTINTVICIADMTMDKNSADGNMCFAYLFDTNKANAKKIQVNTGGAYTFDGLGAVWDNNGYLTQFTAPADGFVRLQASYIGADSVITLE